MPPGRPAAAERALAEQVLSTVPDVDKLLYARVDMAEDAAGQPILTELELVEPGLYLRFHHASIPAFVQAIVEVAEAARGSGHLVGDAVEAGTLGRPGDQVAVQALAG